MIVILGNQVSADVHMLIIYKQFDSEWTCDFLHVYMCMCTCVCAFMFVLSCGADLGQI